MAAIESHHRKVDVTRGHYRRLLLMAGLSLPAMYGLMYAMVNEAGNRGIAAASAAALVAFGLLIRQQTAISDAQFLLSMIPHHAGAILMCGEAPIKDAQILTLCGNIESSQRAEIEEMKAILARLQQ